MSRDAAAKAILLATLLCGSLDIMFAFLLAHLRGREPGAVLRYVASGPFPPAAEWGTAGAILGLAVHFALMAIMVVLFVIAARHQQALLDRPLVAGLGYGLITFVAMNLIVVPLRFPAAFPPKPTFLATQLFAHIVLVGIPLALIARRFLRG